MKSRSKGKIRTMVRTALPAPPPPTQLPLSCLTKCIFQKSRWLEGGLIHSWAKQKSWTHMASRSRVDWNRQEWDEAAWQTCTSLFIAVLLQLRHILLIDSIDSLCLQLHRSIQATGPLVCLAWISLKLVADTGQQMAKTGNSSQPIRSLLTVLNKAHWGRKLK
jgi:hypothetical protein